MITVTQIVDAERLNEYHGFRHRIYSNSRLSGFLSGSEGLDRDRYDAQANHLGWYNDGRLAACARLIEPLDSEPCIPMLGYMTGSDAEAVRNFLSERKRLGHRFIEVSRLCIDPQVRGIRKAREFVLALIAWAHDVNIDHGVFDCAADHAAFYQRLGFAPLPQTGKFRPQVPGSPIASTLVYDYARLHLSDH